MENKLIKFSIITGALIISLSVAYFFIFFLPNHLEKKEDFENNLKCQEAGWKLYKDREKEIDQSNKYFERIYLSLPLFKFSKSLNTCLYERTENVISSEYFKSEIIDVNTNNRIVGCACLTKDGKRKCTILEGSGLVSEEEYQKKRRELFGKELVGD